MSDAKPSASASIEPHLLIEAAAIGMSTIIARVGVYESLSPYMKEKYDRLSELHRLGCDASRETKQSHERAREPDGYAVLLDDPKGDTPGGCGYWYVGAYRTKQGARVVPMYFAPPANVAPRFGDETGATHFVPPSSTAAHDEHPDRASLRDLAKRAKDWILMDDDRVYAVVERGRPEKTPLRLRDLIELAIEPRSAIALTKEKS